jgi:hypothetical protein
VRRYRQSGDTFGVDATCQSDGQCVWKTSDPVLDLQPAGQQADDAEAESDLRALIPDIESYYADFGSYNSPATPMTIEYLKTTYDQSLNTDPTSGPQYTVAPSPGGQSYCASVTAGSSSFYKAGPDAPISSGSCP